jgi:hypothetical protein
MKFTANIVKNEIVTEEKIQCISTNETYLFSKVWLHTETGKKYYISKMYGKSCFLEIMEG